MFIKKLVYGDRKMSLRSSVTGFLLIIGLLISPTLAFENLNAKEFKEKLEKTKNAILIDVRTPKEYLEDGHIPNSNLIPLQIFEYIYLGGLKDKSVFVYCRSGHRSAKASEILEKMGIKKIYNLKGGFRSWKSAGFPVEYGYK